MSLFPVEPRTPDELLASGLAVIDSAFAAGAAVMAPLYSGGHDSLCVCHIASRHPRFGGEVHHIDTGIGAKATRSHVEDVCREFGWKLSVYKSPSTYEEFVRSRGFPGPAMHQWAYVRLKERCVRVIARGKKIALLTGSRREESVRRMGHVEPLKIGDPTTRKKNGRRVRVMVNKGRFWTAPCFDWSVAEQQAYMAEHDLPRNPLKDRLGMSGECFCGAFAAPGELARVRAFAPDVAAEIDRLAGVARQCGKHDAWGTRPPAERKGLALAPTGPLCGACDRRAYAAGLLFAEPTADVPARLPAGL